MTAYFAILFDHVVTTLADNWPYLTVGIVSAAVITTYVGNDRIVGWLRARTAVAVLGAVVAAVATPLCSCGTTTVVLSLLASSAPWAPIVAFMVSSPLTSPSELLLSAGLFGWPFALLFFVGSIALGLAAGALTWLLEGRGLLVGQARFAAPSLGRSNQLVAELPDGGPGAAQVVVVPPAGRWRLRPLAGSIASLGRTMVVLFVAYTVVGYAVIGLVGNDFITGLMGAQSTASIPLAATLGIPFYVSTDGSMPFVAAMVSAGMGHGAAMAFLVTGAGTSVGALSGALLIARWRILAIIVAVLWIGAIVLGLSTALLIG